MKSQETTARLENILKKVKDETEVKKYMDKYTAESYDSFARYFNEYIGEHNLTAPKITTLPSSSSLMALLNRYSGSAESA